MLNKKSELIEKKTQKTTNSELEAIYNYANAVSTLKRQTEYKVNNIPVTKYSARSDCDGFNVITTNKKQITILNNQVNKVYVHKSTDYNEPRVTLLKYVAKNADLLKSIHVGDQVPFEYYVLDIYEPVR